MKLSERLMAIADFVPYNAKVLDIGTDHALLSIFLIKNNLVKYDIIASDNKKGPLESAKKNIGIFELQSRIHLRLSDGLKNIVDDVDCIIIAGMGGSLITKILNDSKDKLKNYQTIILQPNNSEYSVREFINKNNLKIIDESMIYEDGHYYSIMLVKSGRAEMDYYDLMYGPILRRQKSIIYLDSLNKKADHLHSIANELKDKNGKQYHILLAKIKEIEKMLEE